MSQVRTTSDSRAYVPLELHSPLACIEDPDRETLIRQTGYPVRDVFFITDKKNLIDHLGICETAQFFGSAFTQNYIAVNFMYMTESGDLCNRNGSVLPGELNTEHSIKLFMDLNFKSNKHII